MDSYTKNFNNYSKVTKIINNKILMQILGIKLCKILNSDPEVIISHQIFGMILNFSLNLIKCNNKIIRIRIYLIPQ